eukprot:TRINITY_DN3438_c0_g1_i4.p1 TRINITY_DN3438_c0_g1~~TRINITY_DN3438_c0_g1_i4.p1  ORF type:complete len:1453 (-),score=442.67 TRINITY_DN3438_c0_g1_i4:115-3945(-)
MHSPSSTISALSSRFSQAPSPYNHSKPLVLEGLSSPKPASSNTFPVRCYLPSGSQAVVPCAPDMNVADMLRLAVKKVPELHGMCIPGDLFATAGETKEGMGSEMFPVGSPFPFAHALHEVLTIKNAIATGTIPAICIIFTPSSNRTPMTPPPVPASLNMEQTMKSRRASAMVPPHHNLVTSGSSSSLLDNEREFPVQLHIPGGQTLVLACKGGDSLARVKNVIVPTALRECGIELSLLMERYTLTVPNATVSSSSSGAPAGSISVASAGGVSYTSVPTMHVSTSNLPVYPNPLYVSTSSPLAPGGGVVDEQASFIELCRSRAIVPKLVLVEKPSAFTKQEKLSNLLIGSLIGRPLSWAVEDLESLHFRQHMARCLFLMDRTKASTGTSSSMPPARLSSKVGNPKAKIMMQLHMPLLEVAKTVVVEEGETANAFVERMYKKHYEKRVSTSGSMPKSPQSYVLKVVGMAEYIYGPHPVHQFEYVQNVMENGKKIELSLVERSDAAVSPSPSHSPAISSVPDADATSREEQALRSAQGFYEIADSQIRYSHDELATATHPWDSLSCFSIWEIRREFKFRVIGMENITRGDLGDMKLYVVAGLYHGGNLLGRIGRTSMIDASTTATPRWYEWINTSILTCNLPRATRVCFTLYGKVGKVKSDKEKEKDKDKDEDEETDKPLAWVNCQLIDYKHELKTGIVSLGMWPDAAANPIGTCVCNSAAGVSTLFIEFDRYTLPVTFPTENYPGLTLPLPGSPSRSVLTEVDSLVAKDPLYPLATSDKELLFANREYISNKSQALPKFLASVPHKDIAHVQEMYKYLKRWAPMRPLDSLELLDSRFADEQVREYAVECLSRLSDNELHDYLLQLVQVLKYEPYHDSVLARFLVDRALRNPRLGHSLFWYLKSEMHVPEISERFGLMLEAYLRGCGGHREELGRQNEVLKSLVRVANLIKPLKDDIRKPTMLAELEKVKFPARFQLPLNPRWEANGVILSKCKYMDSKKLPLWLVFSNADAAGAPMYVIFKSGDDLRQDMLTLQMIQLMDKLWQNESLDLKMSPYGCISTGDGVGMIEVVLNSNTTANIHKEAGGASAALFRADPLSNWIKHYNSSTDDNKKAVENFIRSCAGYCVATYVLGIGDRHNDNVMVTQSGKLFHIDFGHFLGNYKKKFGIKRERAPFVLTPDFAHVMGGEGSTGFLHFVDLCCQAYNILRRHSSMFINLFAMMLSTGIPELQSAADIAYLRDAFALGASDADATKRFTDLIYESLRTKTTQINNAIHILAH